MSGRKPCLGGGCAVRESCDNYASPRVRTQPAERMCPKGEDILDVFARQRRIYAIRRDEAAVAKAVTQANVDTQSKRLARNLADVLAIVQQAGHVGINRKTVQSRLGMAEPYTAHLLRTLAGERKVESTHKQGGAGNLWGTPGIRKKHAAKLRAKRAEVQSELAQRMAIRNAAARQRRADEDEAEGFARPSVVRIVPAHLAEPIRPRGPCSVWGLAA